MSADARDFELSAGESKLEKGLEDTIRARGGAIPSVPDSSPGVRLLILCMGIYKFAMLHVLGFGQDAMHINA